MGKRLTEAEKEEREVGRIINKITKLEKTHGRFLVERACYRYKTTNVNRRKALKEKYDAEETLREIEERLK